MTLPIVPDPASSCPTVAGWLSRRVRFAHAFEPSEAAGEDPFWRGFRTPQDRAFVKVMGGWMNAIFGPQGAASDRRMSVRV